jgi:hypothetical protein
MEASAGFNGKLSARVIRGGPWWRRAALFFPDLFRGWIHHEK